jgi:hypothetical protein
MPTVVVRAALGLLPKRGLGPDRAIGIAMFSRFRKIFVDDSEIT